MQPGTKTFIILLTLLLSLIVVSVSSAVDESPNSSNQEVSTK